jgi:hypothetical protein
MKTNSESDDTPPQPDANQNLFKDQWQREEPDQYDPFGPYYDLPDKLTQEPCPEPKSLIAFSKRAIESQSNLLGNRWLSRQCGALVISPSGHGKSSFSIQASFLWSCGERAFAFKPAEPLRIFIVQAEDDDNDMTEMAGMLNRLSLCDEQLALIEKNTACLWVNDRTGPEFISLLDKVLSGFQPDVLLVNPVSAFVGDDLKNEKVVHQFFRVWLTPLLKKYDCGFLGIHHSPKTNFQSTENYNWFDWMYLAAGHATLTNWARGVLVIVPSTTPGTYRFIAAKRFEKTGWQEREYWFSHSIENGAMLWVPSSAEQITSGKKGRDSEPEDLLAVIPVLDPVPDSLIIIEAKRKLQIGRDKTLDFLKALVQAGKVFRHLFARPRTNAEVKYAQTPQS